MYNQKYNSKEYRQKNKDRIFANNKKWREKNKEKIKIKNLLFLDKTKEYKVKYYLKNRAEVKKRALEWQKNNPESVKLFAAKYRKNYAKIRKEKDRLYRKNNLAKHASYQKNRETIKIKASPSWLTKEQYKEMEEFYFLAKELAWLSEEPLEVDHIVPIKGKTVCGLHVPWNLQILPKSLNRSKSNKLV